VQDELVTRLRAAGCVFAEDEAALLREQAADDGQLEAWADRRVAGEPLEQVLGWAQFRGRRLAVAPGVFVPRARTGLLVDLGAALVRPGDVVLDLCCGVGAIGVSLADAVPGIVLHAVDLDPVAVRCAAANLGPAGTAYVGDLDAPLPAALAGTVALVVANAPYVPTAAIALMPPEARDHEARAALDGGPDGLDVQRRVVQAAVRWLRPGGALVVETSRPQADRSCAIVTAAGLAARVALDDEVGGTAVVGRLPG
jgi:release factor glutamine methyltransferase